MLLFRDIRFIRRFTTTRSRFSIPDWRNQFKQLQLASQISSVLLQRRDWIPVIRNLSLSYKLTPQLFLQILRKTHENPRTTLDFFNWAKSSLRFEPDLLCECRVIQIAVGSGLVESAEPLLDSLVQNHDASDVVECMVRWSKGWNSLSCTLNLVLESYAQKGLYQEALHVFRRMRIHNSSMPTISAYHLLLDALIKENKIRSAWCLYGTMIRCLVPSDSLHWSLAAKILHKEGKSKNIVRLLKLGNPNEEMYGFVIDFYGGNGDFDVVFSLLDEMCYGKLNPGFCVYSSILNEACRLKNARVIDMILGVMVEKSFLVKSCSSENDEIICRLCDMGKTYAAEMFFDKAIGTKINLKDSTYGCMLMALSKGERRKEAIVAYRMICRGGITVDNSCFYELANALCRQDSSGDEVELLIDVIKRGFVPLASKLSKFLSFQCSKGRWKEAEEFLNIILEMGFQPDSFSCSLLMGQYCLSKEFDKAMALHNEIKKTKGSLDVETWNVLLDGLMKHRKVDEALDVFEYMNKLSCLDSRSFVIMIRGLCDAKEMRKAMKIHDKMMKMGMKPDDATYKHLILGFK